VAPIPVRGINTDASTIEVNWSPLASGADQGYAAITGYKLYWDDSGSFEHRVTLNSASVLTY